MAIKFRELPVDTVEFAENKTKKIEIPRVNAIRWLQMYFFVETVEANIADPVEIEDTILKIIKKIRLVFDGDAHKFNVDARKWFYLEKLEKGVAPPTNKDDNQAQNTTKTWFVQLRADFALNRLDETDISALLPSKRFSKLDLEIDWGDKNDMFSAGAANLTITAGNSGCQVEIREAFETDKSIASKFASGDLNTFRDLRESVQAKEIDRAYSDLEDDAFELPIKPAPKVLHKQLVLVEDTSALSRSDSQVTQLQVKDTEGAGETIIRRDWNILHREMKAEYQQEAIDNGVVLIDWLDKLGAGLANQGTDDELKFMAKTIAPVGGNDTFEVLTRYSNGSWPKRG